MKEIKNHEKNLPILKALERNGFDFELTSKECNVSRKHIETLYAQYGSDFFVNDEVIEISKNIHNVCANIDLDFIKKASSLRNIVLEKIEEKIDDVKNITELTNLLKTLHDIIHTNRNIGQSNSININFLQKLEGDFYTKQNINNRVKNITDEDTI